jgi:hypothetical protein
LPQGFQLLRFVQLAERGLAFRGPLLDPLLEIGGELVKLGEAATWSGACVLASARS